MGRWGRDEKEEHGEFSGTETILYDTVMVDPCHHTFGKTHNMYNMRVIQTVNYGLVNNVSILAHQF